MNGEKLFPRVSYKRRRRHTSNPDQPDTNAPYSHRSSNMATQVSWMLELNIQSGREEDFRALMKEMVSAP